MAETHQLAAILFTDIVGYTAMMGDDESKALQLLDRNRSIQKPAIENHNGKLRKEMGDGILASFNSVIDAVECGKEIQEALKNDQELNVRIGIHRSPGSFASNLFTIFSKSMGTPVRTAVNGSGSSFMME